MYVGAYEYSILFSFLKMDRKSAKIFHKGNSGVFSGDCVFSGGTKLWFYRDELLQRGPFWWSAF